jgi:hypothetical protein
MARIDDEQKPLNRPSAEEIVEARKHPGGWIYRIAGHFRPDEDVPPEAIVGAWRVDDFGVVTGEFHPNPKYDQIKHPAIRID